MFFIVDTGMIGYCFFTDDRVLLSQVPQNCYCNSDLFVGKHATVLARPRTLLIAHRVRQRPHESFYPGSTSKQKSIKPYKNLIIYMSFLNFYNSE